MSKSKNNGVDPQSLIEQYGADTARFFIIFASAPEQQLEWSDSGVEGAYRFLRRVWNYAGQFSGKIRAQVGNSYDWAQLPVMYQDLRREIHQHLRQANYDYARFQFNTVASACMKILNVLEKVPGDHEEAGTAVICEGFRIMLCLLSPIAPHLGHELWRACGYGDDVRHARWPQPDEAALAQDEIELVLQVNGKLRGQITVSADAGRETIEAVALGSEAAQKHMEGKPPKKVVVVPGRLVNIVV